jgi:hypothetical protein
MFEKHRTEEIGVQIVGSLYPDSTRIHMLPIKDKSLFLSLSLSTQDCREKNTTNLML